MSLTVFYDMVADMSVLLLFCLPLIFASYVFQLEDKNKHIFAFFTGILVSALLQPLISTVMPQAVSYAHSLKSYVHAVFAAGTGIPLLITALAVFLLSGFQFLAVPSGLFGLFTVKIYQYLFLTSAHPHTMPIVFYLLIYTGTLFIFDAALHFCAELTFYHYAVCCICFFLFAALLFCGHLGWGLWYFGYMRTAYAGSCFAGLMVLGFGLHSVVYRRLGSL